ncbi:MAG: hypothetical protein HKN82_17670 [Akkermansiaceae bacterium]|nr:hypothetical protein [Akkermansiaceae bacterium]
MKGPQLLVVLLVLAAIAGAFLVLRKGRDRPPDPPSGAPEAAVHRFVLEQLGREPGPMPSLTRVPPERLVELTTKTLAGHFGEDGLALRARAYALLHLLPESQDLATQWGTARASADRGCARESPTIALADDFDLFNPTEQGRLARLLTHSLLGPAAGNSDDAYLADWALRGGIAAEIEARFLAQRGGALPLPSNAEMEHEALLLSLPVYTHNLAQLPLMEGRDAVRRRLAAGEDFPEMLAAPPAHTLALLAPAAVLEPTPALPALPGLLLGESLGAYAAALLGERLGDHLDGEALGPAWRADRYGIFQSDGGEHLLWISIWSGEEAAIRMAALLQGQVTPDDPAGRHQRVRRDGTTVTFANCADEFTLDELLPASLDSSAKAP